MKTINYKQIKSINNYIPKYDLGTKPIDRGYLLGNQSVGFGSVDKQAESADSMVSAQWGQDVSDFITNGLSTGYTVYSGLKNKNKTTVPSAAGVASIPTTAYNPTVIGTPVTAPATMLQSVNTALKGNGIWIDLATLESMIKAGEEASKGLAESTASGASSTLTTLSNAANIAGAVLGTGQLGYGLYKQFRNGVSNSDIELMSGRNTQYVGNTAYLTYGGMDVQGMREYINALNTGSTINNMLSGAGAGASIGTIVPGIGPLIGAGAGLAIGALGSWLGWNKSKHAQERRINNAIAQYSAYNQQAESEAASKEMRNNFITADYGVEGSDKVFGNKIDPATGYTFAQEASMLGAPTVPITRNTPKRKDNVLTEINGEPALVGGGEAIVRGSDPIFDELAIRQSMTPDNNPNPYNMTRKQKRNMLRYAKRYDAGTTYSILPGLIGAGVGMGLYFSYKKDNPIAYDTYVENPNAARSLQTLDQLRYDPYFATSAINDATRIGQYSINASPYSAGQRMTMTSLLYNDRMKNMADLYSTAQQINNQYKSAAATAALQEGQNAATRRQQSNQLKRDMYAKAVATRRRGMEQGIANALAPIYSTFSNLNNNYWTKQNIGLYREDLKLKKEEIEKYMNWEHSNKNRQ